MDDPCSCWAVPGEVRSVVVVAAEQKRAPQRAGRHGHRSRRRRWRRRNAGRWRRCGNGRCGRRRWWRLRHRPRYALARRTKALFFVQLLNHLLRNHAQRLEDAVAVHRDGFHTGPISGPIQFFIHIGYRQRIWQIALVKLNDDRNIIDINPVVLQVPASNCPSIRHFLSSCRDWNPRQTPPRRRLAAPICASRRNRPGPARYNRENLVRIPATAPKSSGRKSKNNVRSVSVAIETSSPVELAGALACTTCKFVVFPQRPGP